MRKSTRVSAPLFVVTVYYAFFVFVFAIVWHYFPQLAAYLPVGGIEEMLARGAYSFEAVEIVATDGSILTNIGRLALAMVGVAVLIVPVSWIYFITTPQSQIDRSFAQTIVVLPIVVAGIAMIVQNSIALAFSLAGVVAAVRFRFTLSEPAHALYIFSAIALGLGAGISALGISLVISIAFVYGNLLLWWFDYGANLNSPFFAFLTGRHRDDEL